MLKEKDKNIIWEWEYSLNQTFGEISDEAKNYDEFFQLPENPAIPASGPVQPQLFQNSDNLAENAIDFNQLLQDHGTIQSDCQNSFGNEDCPQNIIPESNKNNNNISDEKNAFGSGNSSLHNTSKKSLISIKKKIKKNKTYLKKKIPIRIENPEYSSIKESSTEISTQAQAHVQAEVLAEAPSKVQAEAPAKVQAKVQIVEKTKKNVTKKKNLFKKNMPLNIMTGLKNYIEFASWFSKDNKTMQYCSQNSEGTVDQCKLNELADFVKNKESTKKKLTSWKGWLESFGHRQYGENMRKFGFRFFSFHLESSVFISRVRNQEEKLFYIKQKEKLKKGMLDVSKLQNIVDEFK